MNSDVNLGQSLEVFFKPAWIGHEFLAVTRTCGARAWGVRNYKRRHFEMNKWGLVDKYIKNEMFKNVGNAFFSLVSLITNLAILNAPVLAVYLLELYSYAQHLAETYHRWIPPFS